MPIAHVMLAVLVAFVWGVNFVVMKAGLEQLDPFLFMSLRFVIVFLIMLPWFRLMKGHMKKLIQVGICIGGLHFAFAIFAVDLAHKISAITVVVQLNLPITLIMAYFFLNEKISYWRTSGIVLAFVGVVIITFDPAIVDERLAILVVMGAAFLYSAGSILTRQLKAVGVFETQSWTAFLAIPVLLPLSLYFETDQISQVVAMDMRGWLLVGYTSVVSSIVGYGGFNYLLRRHPVVEFAPFMLLVPVFATIASVIFLDETISARFLIGGAVTFGGLGIINFREWWLKHRVARGFVP